jgi:chromosome segregation ATPase
MAPLATLFLVALALQGPGYPAQPSARDRAAARPSETVSATDAAALRRSIDALSRQVALLRQQIADQQATDMRRFNANVARLQLVLADLDRMKKERADVMARLRSAQAREDDARERLDNIQRELSLSGELDRTAAENRIRTTYNRQLDQATREANDAERDLEELDARIDRAERMADTLRRRLRIDDSQIDVDDTPAPKPEPEPEPQPENP